MARQVRKKSITEIKRAQILRSRRKALRITSFSPAEKSISGRVCEFLHWASLKYPKSIITYEEITQAVFMLGKKPSTGSKAVKSVTSAISRSRKVMKPKYKQDILTEKGVGARATVDELDVLSTSILRDTETHRRSAAKLKSTVDLINEKKLDRLIAQAPKEVRDEIMITRAWYTESLGKYIKMLEKPSSAKALLPPVP
jgi:hypothetical protein